MARNYSKQEVVEFLRSMSIMTAAVCGERGPISTVVLFAVSDDLRVYFATRRDSFKAKALEGDGRISMAVWKHRTMLVQADGMAGEVKEKEKINWCLDELVKSAERVEDFWPPLLRISGDDYVVFEVGLHWLRVLDLSETTMVSGEPPFVELALDI